MKSSNIDLEQGKKIAEMAFSKDKEMSELGFTLANEYFTCYKDFKKFRDMYLMEKRYSPYNTDTGKPEKNLPKYRKLMTPVEARFMLIAKNIERKRRLPKNE